MLFKTENMEEDFKERLIEDIDEEYYITDFMKRLALKEFIDRHNTIELQKRLKPSDNIRKPQSEDVNTPEKPCPKCGAKSGKCIEALFG